MDYDSAIFGGTVRNTASWGLDRIDTNNNLDNCFNLLCSLTGKGVDVYVLDTGVNYDHKEFSGKVRYASESQKDLHIHTYVIDTDIIDSYYIM